MKNYYKILNIDPSLDERKLELLLANLDYKYDMILNNSSNQDMLYKAKKYKDLIEEFNAILVSYGSKNNYDRALKISEKANSIKLKVGNIDKKRKYKIAISLITAGVIAIGAGTIIKRNLKITEIPIYPEDSIESILQDYDIDGIQLIGEDNINFRPKYYDSESGVKIIHKRKEEDKINEITDERKNNHNPKTEYSFKYIVKSGDTVSGLQLTIIVSNPNFLSAIEA